MLEEAKQELEKIEYKKRTWNSKFIRELEIWESIVVNLNAKTSKKEHKHWGLVMDLYHKKYR